MLNRHGVTCRLCTHSREADDLIARVDELLGLDVIALPRFEPITPGLGESL
jgi:hypothetical protein